MDCAVAEEFSESYPVPMQLVGLADRFADTCPQVAALLGKYWMRSRCPG